VQHQEYDIAYNVVYSSVNQKVLPTATAV